MVNDFSALEDYDREPAEADQPDEPPVSEQDVESGPMREHPQGSGRVPGQVALGQESLEGAAPPWEDDLIEARALIRQGIVLLDQGIKRMSADADVGRRASQRAEDRELCRIALASLIQATNAQIAALARIPRQRANIALHYLSSEDPRIAVVRKGLYRWKGEPIPPSAEEVAVSPPPAPPPSPRLAAKREREAEAARLAAEQPLAIPRPAAAAIVRPYVEPDDTEPEDKLRRGEPLPTPDPRDDPPPAPPVQGAVIPEIDTTVELVAWDPAWGPKPKAE
jgi:hypothetical protein